MHLEDFTEVADVKENSILASPNVKDSLKGANTKYAVSADFEQWEA